MIVYDKLFVMLNEKGISQYKLITEYGISRGQLDRLKQNQNVTANTLDTLCNILDCNLSDIATYIKDDKDFNKK